MCNVYITICIKAYITSGHCTVYFIENILDGITELSRPGFGKT